MNDSDENTKVCPHCAGAGGWESTFGQFIEWICCHTCNGDGVLDEEAYTEHIKHQIVSQDMEVSSQ